MCQLTHRATRVDSYLMIDNGKKADICRLIDIDQNYLLIEIEETYQVCDNDTMRKDTCQVIKDTMFDKYR